MSLFQRTLFLKGFPPWKSALFFLLLYVLAGVFFYAGMVKLVNRETFFEDILNYRILERESSWALALYLPWLEMVAAGGLLWSRSREGALLAVTGLLVIFLGAIFSAWFRGLDITCGCFGSGGEPAHYPTLVLRDLALLAGVAILLMLDAEDLRGRAENTAETDEGMPEGVVEAKTE